MRKNKFNISEFKKRYEVVLRKILVNVGIFTVCAYSLATPATPTVSFFDEVPAVRTEVSVSKATVLKEQVNTQILEIAAQTQFETWTEVVDEVCSWPENWDQEGAAAVLPGVEASVKRVLAETRDYIDILDNIYPTAFGSICMEWGAGINWINAEVTADSFHFYHGNGGVRPSFIFPNTKIDGSNLNHLKNRLSVLSAEL